MSDFADWEFMLNGNAQEFRNFTSERGTALFNIYGGIDHWLDCPNDDFRMTTLYCEGETDPHVVWQVGYELVGLFNGASALLKKNHRQISIHRLLHKSRDVPYVPPQGSKALLGKPSFPAQQLHEEFENSKKSDIRLRLLHLATENEDAYFILKYLEMESGWVTYYKLLEAVEHFAEKASVDLKTVESKRKAFTNTANNFSLSGFDSRHGFKEVTKKNNTPSMSLGEAHEFVTGVAKKYLTMTHLKK